MTSPPDDAAGAARAAGGAMLRLRAAPSCVRADGKCVDLEVKDAVLLAYLAIEGPTSRIELSARLWPDAAAERARANLRQRLMRLRRLAGRDLLTGGDPVRLGADIAHDLEEASDVLAAAALVEAGGFAEWLDTTRRARRALRGERLAAAAARAEGAGELAAALEHAQALLALDGLSEHAHRRVMRLHYLRGDVAAARAAYQRCAEVMAHELGVSPSIETETLRRQIENSAPAMVPGRGPLPVTLLRPPRMVGRDAALQRLHDAWTESRAFLAIGEPGIGKTRLLEEFVAGCPGALLVSARPSDRDVPLVLLARLVRQLGSRLARFTQHARHAELVALLPSGSEPPAGARPRRIGALVGAMLADPDLAGIVIDDLQWADTASLEALREARARDEAAHVRWGFAARPPEDDPGAERLAGLRAECAVETVDLGPLDADTLANMLHSVGVATGDVHGATRTLLAKVGGNPLFVLEVLRHARTSGTDWQRMDVPPRVSDLMDRRVQALAEGSLMLARVAAVAGTDFSAELAETVSGLDALALATPWHDLEAAHLLHGAAFMHDVALAAVNRSIPPAIAARLHAKVADHLERVAADPARIVRHRLAAGQEQEAVPFLSAAGRRAWLAGCAQEAASFYFRAADIELAAGRPDPAFTTLFAAAEAISELGTLDLFERVFEKAAALATTPAQHATVRFFDAFRWQMRGGDATGFAAKVDEALVLAIAAGERRIEAECRFAKAHIATLGGRLNESVQLLAAAETLFREHGPPHRALAVQVSIPALLGMLGQSERALELFASQRPALLRCEDRRLLLNARADEGLNALNLGRYAQAIDAADAIVDMLRTVDVAEDHIPRAAANCSKILRSVGEPGRALNVLDVASARLGGSPLAALADAERASVLLELGRPDLATRALAAFERVAPRSARTQQRLRIVGGLLQAVPGGSVLAGSDDIDPPAIEDLGVAFDWMLVRGRAPAAGPALRQSEELLERCTAQGLQALRGPLLALNAKFAAELGDAATAARSAAEAASCVRRGLPAALPLASLWLATAFKSAGENDEARRWTQIGCDWVERVARVSVPEEFRASFLDRNPVHRALRLAATRIDRPSEGTKSVAPRRLSSS